MPTQLRCFGLVGFQRENRNLHLVVVQDAKVLVEAGAETPVLGSKGQRCALWSGLSGARHWFEATKSREPACPCSFAASGIRRP
ncbi:MAG: hypothetical protein N0E48_13280 [Candidatus Thiodiazotropha endolucinida]|nr:hypothetical protein [Candidatus Thiodiazotropha taylori]MCW4344303.1 hypothetical protein [Candidatus Thiodiazotropha endolucinida]